MKNKVFGKLVFYSIKLEILIFLNLTFFLFKKNLRVKKEGGFYLVYSGSYKIYFYLLQRVDLYLKGIDFRFKNLFNEYFLDLIDFEEGDNIIDCGAHLGELIYYFKDTKINYFAFEPSAKLCNCIKKNISLNHNNYLSYKVVNKALLDIEDKVSIYLRDETGDTSLEADSFSKSIKVDSIRLDQYFKENTSIKLLKIDAEGFEYEVLKGAENILSSIKFIAVDAGFEKASNTLDTFDEVNDFLLANGFTLENENHFRHTYLYLNSRI
jgi:FkbM family methyltransferase